MNSILLLFCLIICTYCLSMSSVSRDSRTSLTTNTSEDKYFYLANIYYLDYIYICLEDSNFGLNYSDIKVCFTNTNPRSYPEDAVNDCIFSPISYYKNVTYSSPQRYYYKFSKSSKYSYSIVNYNGSYSSGYISVTSNYNDFIQMTKVYINKEVSLPTYNSYDKYFYLNNSEYSRYSSYIYISFLDDGFDIANSIIKVCYTNTDPSFALTDAINNCSFSPISYHRNQTFIEPYKYYYKFPKSSNYSYSIIFYEGRYIRQRLEVTCNSEDFIKIARIYGNKKTSLESKSFYDNFFYIASGNYYKYSDYIYISFEDVYFGLVYTNIKLCATNIYPGYYPIDAVNNCTFSNLSYYKIITYSSPQRYLYKFSSNSSYDYFIIYYEGKNPSYKLNVTIDYKDLVPNIKMTEVNIRTNISLPITYTDYKYFYLTTSEYSSYSKYIYILFKDNKFDLSSYLISVCSTSINPGSFPVDAVNNCSFSKISFYLYKGDYIPKKYYYKLSIDSENEYFIIYYQTHSDYSSGYLWVKSDYNDLVNDIMMTQVHLNKRKSLPTNITEDKYFYVTNSEYYSHSSYIYFVSKIKIITSIYMI